VCLCRGSMLLIITIEPTSRVPRCPMDRFWTPAEGGRNRRKIGDNSDPRVRHLRLPAGERLTFFVWAGSRSSSKGLKINGDQRGTGRKRVRPW
jgi:hypothetical protein